MSNVFYSTATCTYFFFIPFFFVVFFSPQRREEEAGSVVGVKRLFLSGQRLELIIFFWKHTIYCICILHYSHFHLALWCQAIAPCLKCPEEYRAPYSYHPEVKVTVKMTTNNTVYSKREKKNPQGILMRKIKGSIISTWTLNKWPMEHDLYCSFSPNG